MGLKRGSQEAAAGRRNCECFITSSKNLQAFQFPSFKYFVCCHKKHPTPCLRDWRGDAPPLRHFPNIKPSTQLWSSFQILAGTSTTLRLSTRPMKLEFVR